ncbi:MLO-like protein 11 [Camellia lanceoleosa]|uniref:MLO-like protein 11 n=1 Tax=Camellia lanceoleosa TaxID=1840588 RepID=A0ACC0G102_9ERIC|nr:MLO-like protein 11 [Camellia lanceoleosa]
MTIFVVVSLLVEQSIHHLSNWLQKTNRKPLFEAVEKMKEELMLLGFISLILTTTSGVISNIYIPTLFYESVFSPCTKSEAQDVTKNNVSSRAIAPLHLHHGNHTCILQLPNNVAGNCEGYILFCNCSCSYLVGRKISKVSRKKLCTVLVSPKSQ